MRGDQKRQGRRDGRPLSKLLNRVFVVRSEEQVSVRWNHCGHLDQLYAFLF